MELRGFIIACIAVWMIMTESNGQYPRQNNQRNAQHYQRYLSSSSRYKFRPNAKIRPKPNRPASRFSNLRYASPQAGVRGTLRPNRFAGINRNFGNRQALGYGNYLRKLSQGYYPQAYARQQNSVNSYSPYKTGFPLRAPSPGGYSPNYAPLPLSAPSLYGYGGYQTDRWGLWSSWSQCSRSCDGGVQERTRTCMSARLSMTLSLYKGQGHNQGNCPGFGKEFQPCNTKPCVSVKSFQDQKYDARKHQCSRFDKKEYLGQKYTWMPYIRGGLNECRLYCMAKGFRMFVELANKVDEGSPCGKNGNEACFGGICSREPPKKKPNRPNSLVAGANPGLAIKKQQLPPKIKSPLGYIPPSGQNPNNRFRPLHPQNPLLASQNRIHQTRNKFTQNQGRLPQNRLQQNLRPQVLSRFPQNQGRLSSSRRGQFQNVQGGRFPQNRLPLPQRQRPGLQNSGRIPNQGRNSRFQVSNVRALQSGSPTRPNGYLRGGKSSDQILRELNKKIISGGQFNPASAVKVDKKVSGEYNKKEGLKLGYNPIFKIPKGASNIRVEEARPSQNYLAIKVGDDYLVNGRWSIALKKDIKAAGTLIRYRLGKGPGSTEIITAAGPTTKEIQIVLLFQQGPPEVHYNYTLKVLGSREDRVFKAAAVSARKNSGPGQKLKNRPTLHWSVDGWKKCTRPCGGGEQQLNIRCVAIYPNKRTKVVKSSYCHALKKPAQRKRMCNMHTCKPRWVLLPWKPCSKTCGQGAFQTRDVRCVKVILTERGKVEINSPFYECGPRPAIQKPCAYVTCFTWKTDNWSSCSKTCDKGVQTRKAFCTSGNRLHDDEQCDIKTKPELAQVCNLRPCRTSWFIGKWSKCSKFCGEGVERRPVFCAGKDGSALSESLCRDQPKPSATRACINQKCEGIWVTSNWTQCSTQCGLGHISRMVICLSMKDGLMNQVSEDNCDLTTKPESKKECKRKPCNPEWFTSEWSHCSRTCGRGIRVRQINCMLKNGQLGRGCQAETRPNAAMICQIRACENEIDEGVAKATFSGKATENAQEVSDEGVNDGEVKPEERGKRGSADVVPSNELGRSTSTVQQTTQSQPKDRSEAPTEFSRVQTTIKDNSQSSAPTKRISSERASPVEARDSRSKKDGYAAAETIVANPITRFFKQNIRNTERKRELTTTERLTTTEKITTTRAPTPKPTPKPTKAPRRQEVNICKDSFKINYCRVILRIGFCKFSTYRKRCCGSCEKSSVSMR